MTRRASAEPLLALILGERPGISTRDKAILVERLTLPREAGSLPAIGRRHGLTRERVRQVVKRAFAIVDAWTGFSLPLRRRLDRLAARAPIPLARLEKEAWASGLPLHGALRVVEAYSELRLVRDPRLGDCLMPLAPDAWRSVRAAVEAEILASPPDVGHVDVFRAALDRVGLAGQAREACLRAHDRVHPVSAPPGPGNPHARTPSASAGPPEPAPLPVTPEAADAIARRCAEVVAAGPPGRRWRTWELMTEARGEGAWHDGLTPAEFDRILATHPGLLRVGASTWSDRDARARGWSPRSLAESILERHGKPMPKAELQRRVVEIWGSGASGQVAPAPGSRLVGLPGSLWGLGDRDVPLDEASVGAIAAEALRQVERGEARIAGIRQALAAAGLTLDPLHVAAVLKARLGYRVGHGGKLHPPRTGPAPRSRSLNEILATILREHPRGLDEASLREAAAAVTGRPPAQATVRRALRLHRDRGEGETASGDGTGRASARHVTGKRPPDGLPGGDPSA